MDLGGKLSDAARALGDAGAPPADGLVEDLAGARNRFIQLRTDVLSAAEAASVPPSAEPESLTDLEPLLGAIADAIEAQARRARLEETRTRALVTLDRVLELVHRDDPAFSALASCQARARDLRDMAGSLTDPDAPAAAELGTIVECFDDLLTMLESRDVLDDDRYAELEESVSRAFGRPLAVAVARGRLAFATDVPVQPPPPPDPEPVGPESPAPTLEMPPLPLEPTAAEPIGFAPAPPIEMPPPLELEPATAEPVAATPAPTIEIPPLELEPASAEPSAAMPAPTIEIPPLELETPAADVPEAPPVTVASSPAQLPPPVPEPTEPSEPDETAQWWLAAWARWSGWKSTHDFAEVVREELGKYPYLLSVPIQSSPEYEDGLLAYGYSILLDHVERQRAGCVGSALNSLRAGERRPVGEQLYDYLVAEGRLPESYPEFVRNAVVAAVPEPGLWFQFRILESKEDTRIFQRPSARLGETELAGQRLASDGQRYAEHKFKMTLGPLTTRFVLISADMIREARSFGVRVVVDGQASDSGWIVTVPQGRRGTPDGRRVEPDGTHVQGLGKEFGSAWIAVFNADPGADRRYELSVFLRKDSRSPFRGKG